MLYEVITNPLPCAGKAPFLTSAAGRKQRPLRCFGGAGDDVDHAVDRIGPPEGGTWAADDLDALDVLEQGVLDVPEDAGEEVVVEGAAGHEDEELVGEAAVEAAGGDGPGVAADPRHLDAGRQAQGLP